MKLILLPIFLILTGCSSIPVEHDLPYGDPDWEFRVMYHTLGF